MEIYNNIEIVWQAFGNKPERNKFVTAVNFTIKTPLLTKAQRLEFCEIVYSATNTYGAVHKDIWSQIEPLLSETRTHTALSIGDKITIGYSHTYIVAEVGFVKISGWEE